MLTTADHSRDSAEMRYVYHVLSRRAGGVSVGINLNPNNACNWACVYCQVPDLTRGGPPPIDLALLETELNEFLRRAARADFWAAQATDGLPRIVDVAFAGNGEPTGAPELDAALNIVAQALAVRQMTGSVKIRLISNGSRVDRADVRAALARLGALDGEVWFKVDAASPAAILRINGVHLKPETVRRRLRLCAGLAPTWVQTCMFAQDGTPLPEADIVAYLDFLESVSDVVAGVLLYGLARPSCQPGAERLGQLPEAWLDDLAARIRQRGLTARVSP